MVDLHQFFADGFSSSQANAIDALGNIVGYATDTSGHTHAILWQPVHEPGTLSLLGILGICLSGYGWRRRKH
jgi:probable HAF family extracellular repeat protein